MSTALIVALFGSGTFGAVLVAIVNGLFFKRRTGAEATEMIQRAAAGLTTSVTVELERVTRQHQLDRETWETQRSALEETMRREREESRAVLQLHAAWDALVFAAVREAGMDSIPEPPPLLPPHS